MNIRDQLLARMGGAERFAASFAWRSFRPDRAAELALDGGVIGAANGAAAIAAVAGDQADALIAEWVERYVDKWIKYQAAGARTANWMITGPARFPVDRNRKRLDVEHKRLGELLDFEAGAGAWARKRVAMAERAELVAAAELAGEVQPERIVAGIRLVENKVLDRVQLIFPDKPSAEERAELKRHAFRWAPSAGAWQRQLTANGLRAAEVVLAKLAA